ncbi:hypothetical protein F5Y14DRAFT_416088 [Nemania sp. NC0429]|nr:hypothetical protein F5Y14DRAFT_416088 [Nemania sp. NC0429]
MLCIWTPSIAVVAAALMLGALAGELDPFQFQQAYYSGRLQLMDDPNANLNIFKGALGGATAPPITPSTDAQHPYSISGENVPDFNAAVDKTCNFQKNNCSNLAHGALKSELSVPQCDEQFRACTSTLRYSATQTAFFSKETVAGNDDFDFLCEN